MATPSPKDWQSGRKEQKPGGPPCRPPAEPTVPRHNGRPCRGVGPGALLLSVCLGSPPGSPGDRGPALLPSCHRLSLQHPHTRSLKEQQVSSPLETLLLNGTTTTLPPSGLPGLSGCRPHSAILCDDSVPTTAMPAAPSLSGPELCSYHLVFISMTTPNTVVTPSHLKVKPLSPEPEPALLLLSGKPTDGPAVYPSQDLLNAPHTSAAGPHFPPDQSQAQGQSCLAYTLNSLPLHILLTCLVQPQPWSFTTLHPHCAAQVAREGTQKRPAAVCRFHSWSLPRGPSSSHSPTLQVPMSQLLKALVLAPTLPVTCHLATRPLAQRESSGDEKVRSPLSLISQALLSSNIGLCRGQGQATAHRPHGGQPVSHPSPPSRSSSLPCTASTSPITQPKACGSPPGNVVSGPTPQRLRHSLLPS